MKRTQETFKVVYSYTTGHDPEPNIVEVYLWALENNHEDASRVFWQKRLHMNSNIISIESCDPPTGVVILEL